MSRNKALNILNDWNNIQDISFLVNLNKKQLQIIKSIYEEIRRVIENKDLDSIIEYIVSDNLSDLIKNIIQSNLHKEDKKEIIKYYLLKTRSNKEAFCYFYKDIYTLVLTNIVINETKELEESYLLKENYQYLRQDDIDRIKNNIRTSVNICIKEKDIYKDYCVFYNEDFVDIFIGYIRDDDYEDEDSISFVDKLGNRQSLVVAIKSSSTKYVDDLIDTIPFISTEEGEVYGYIYYVTQKDVKDNLNKIIESVLYNFDELLLNIHVNKLIVDSDGVLRKGVTNVEVYSLEGDDYYFRWDDEDISLELDKLITQAYRIIAREENNFDSIFLFITKETYEVPLDINGELRYTTAWEIKNVNNECVLIEQEVVWNYDSEEVSSEENIWEE